MKKLLFIITFLLLFAVNGFAAVYVKNISGTVYYESGASSCDDVTAADTSGDLEAALTAAGSSGTLYVCEGTYGLTDLDSDYELDFTADGQTLEGIGTVTFTRERSLDGSWTFDTSTQVYEEDEAWNNTSGEIYDKNCYVLHSLMEDGILLTGTNFADEAAVIAGLSRGEWCRTVSNKIYYRASDGGAPSTHTLTASDVPTGGKAFIDLVTYSNITVKNIDFYHHFTNQALDTGSGDNILFDNIEVSFVYRFGAITDTTNFTLQNSYIHDTQESMVFQGDSTATVQNNRFYKCGYYPRYDGNYAYDGDAIGVGGSGGTMTITISENNFETSGPAADQEATQKGRHVTISTSNAMSATVNLQRNYFKDAHSGAVRGSEKWVAGNVINNLFIDTCNNHTGSSVYGWAALEWTIAGLTSDGVVSNNDFISNHCRSTIYILQASEPSYYLRLKNNLIKNNGYDNTVYASTAWRGDLWSPHNVTYLDSDYNLWYLNGTDWDAQTVITHNSVEYERDEIEDCTSEAQCWEDDTSNDANSVTEQDPLLSSTYRPQSGSPAIDSGDNTIFSTHTLSYNKVLLINAEGNVVAYNKTIDIGANEFKPSLIWNNILQ